MTVSDIQRVLMSDYVTSTVMPNYTPLNWFECDVFELTKSDYFREYEIKLSRADFFADAKKEKTSWVALDEPVGGRHFKQVSTGTKHSRISAGDPTGPVEFYFCTPKGLVTADEIPPWAGWIEFYWNAPHESVRRVLSLLAKAAPRLHRTKADPSVRNDVHRISYYRFHSLRIRVRGLSEEQNSPASQERPQCCESPAPSPHST